ncbi:hypothetical protein MZO42_11070 [Sphingomonas psychrotolerans]|uniref:Terminase n=1 Tax=Sphingomonas psychrotolerans TaxID=1327635 RepID=A0ABU3N3X7_9SPHN|nr:hypothetical protein [Sphingomonas psychrotolerans]MDT8759238.1 hypothetical protein [Sphingomonas psychrotolerans]
MDDLIMGNQDGQRQQRKPRRPLFSARRRQRFLDALALTCNVRVAAAHAGVVTSTVYRHRAQDPQFVAQWRQALEAGYDRLETLVLEHGGAGMPLEPADPERAAAEMQAEAQGGTGVALPPFDFARAMELLRHHRMSRHAAGIAHGQQRRAATREETNAALAKAIAAAEKRMGKSDGA